MSGAKRRIFFVLPIQFLGSTTTSTISRFGELFHNGHSVRFGMHKRKTDNKIVHLSIRTSLFVSLICLSLHMEFDRYCTEVGLPWKYSDTFGTTITKMTETPVHKKSHVQYGIPYSIKEILHCGVCSVYLSVYLYLSSTKAQNTLW